MSSKKNTTAVKKEDIPSLVPKLRFPEFRDAEGWKSKTLGQMGTFIRGLTYTPGDVADKGLLVLRSGNIQDGSLVFDKDLVFVEKTCNPDLLLRGDDVVICMSNGSKALVGKSGEYLQDYGGEVTIGAFCSLYRPQNPFSKIAFRSEQYLDFIADSIMGGNINNLKNSTLERFPFPVPPSNAEQQKIASCLSTVDELIAAQARKLDTLKNHKKGLMQQLFPREGETQPRLRFPEFQNKGEWSEEKLTEIAKTTIGLVTTMTTSYASKGVPLIRNSDIKENTVRKGKLIYLLESFADKHSNKKLIEGDIVTVHTGDIGVSAVIDRDLSGCLGFATLNTRLLNRDVSPEYLCWYFNSERYIRFALSMATGDGRNNFNLSDFNLSVIPIPSKAEQQRIATCLSSLDALITAETQKHEALKTHKKGLMQQLFPSLEEVEA
jgi:type I restriction enzyme S subunit